MVPFKNFSEKVIQYLENVFLQFLMLSVVCVFHLHLTPRPADLGHVYVIFCFPTFNYVGN